MLKQTVVALSAVVVLVAALGSASYAQQYDWSRAYNSKAGQNCVNGTTTVDENAASANPSWWTHCR